MREKLLRFMYGRNGNDALNRFLIILGLVLMLLSMFLPSGVGKFFSLPFLAVLGYAYFRMFSRNLYKARRRTPGIGKSARPLSPLFAC